MHESVALADTSITLDGNVPTDALQHFFVPFDVPDGTQEIEILHDDQSADNILDWGLYDPAGWRGWGGGNSENIVVNAKAASRSYVPGPITKGTWKVVVGKAKVIVSPATYHIVVTFKTAASLAPQTERKPYVAGAALAKGPRYFAGDLHVHSRESGDAIPTLDEIGTFARSRGLDFVEISDHNVNTQDDYVAASQARFPDLLFIPGIEFTTYAGHANAIGATRWVDHKIGQPGVTIGGAVEQIAAQGAIFSINHPALDIGDLCIGCAWKHTLDPAKVTGVEIETSALSGGGLLFQSKAIAFWESYLDKGFHVVGLGGGDDHRAGKETGQFQSALGSPTTLVYADELSAGAIMDAIRKGARGGEDRWPRRSHGGAHERQRPSWRLTPAAQRRAHGQGHQHQRGTAHHHRALGEERRARRSVRRHRRRSDVHARRDGAANGRGSLPVRGAPFRQQAAPHHQPHLPHP
jgi:hypothetical protein